MAFGQDSGGAVLAFVTRVVKGDIFISSTTFNEATQKNETLQVPVEEPVIVFFPNKTCQVLPKVVAEKMGYLMQPTILNFDAVDRPDTIAGKYKFAMSEQTRKDMWLLMENEVISACMSRGGHPMPLDARYSEHSIFFDPPTRKEKAA